MSREERLQKQREKQAEFRRNLAAERRVDTKDLIPPTVATFAAPPPPPPLPPPPPPPMILVSARQVSPIYKDSFHILWDFLRFLFFEILMGLLMGLA